MNETLQTATAETGADDPEYQAYRERNPATESMEPLSYEAWREWQSERADNTPPPGQPPEAVLGHEPEHTPDSGNPNSSATAPGNINYENGHQVVITNNPTFNNNNNPNFNMGGNQVVGEGEISAPAPQMAVGNQEPPGRAEPEPRLPEQPEAGRQEESRGEVEELRNQVNELRDQLRQEREERNRQHQEQMRAIRDLTEALRQQNENIMRLLEGRHNQPEPEPQPEPQPEPEPEPEPGEPGQTPEPQPPEQAPEPGEQPPEPGEHPPEEPEPEQPPEEPPAPPAEWPMPPPEADGATAVMEHHEEEEPGRLRRIWNRIRGAYIGGTYHYIVGEHITEEEQGERRRSRWFKRALGAAAVAGITSLAWWLATRGGHSVHGHETVTQFHGGSAGNHAFGLELPPGDHLVSVNGHDVITDSSGQIIVGQLKDGMFDAQGNLSQAARQTFVQNGLKVTQEFLKWGDGKQHFITRVTR